MCRCAERRAAIVAAITAASHGDTTKVGPAISFVGRTMVEDAASVTRSALSAARLRLGARR